MGTFFSGVIIPTGGEKKKKQCHLELKLITTFYFIKYTIGMGGGRRILGGGGGTSLPTY
jgi:hypothetical protein